VEGLRPDTVVDFRTIFPEYPEDVPPPCMELCRTSFRIRHVTRQSIKTRSRPRPRPHDKTQRQDQGPNDKSRPKTKDPRPNNKAKTRNDQRPKTNGCQVPRSKCKAPRPRVTRVTKATKATRAKGLIITLAYTLTLTLTLTLTQTLTF
jgi:hypothetical protein